MDFATTILSGLRSRLSEQNGFTMIPAVMAMMVGTLLSLGAWAAAESDVQFTDKDRWVRVAQQKAQSGVSDYVQRIAENSGFWNQCDQPGETETTGLGEHAINDTDFGTTMHPRRRWLPYSAAGSANDRELNSQYTIDLVPIRAGDTCKPKSSSAQRMIDPQSGTFRVRVTGRAGPQVPANVAAANVESWRQTNWKRVSTVVEFRRNGFLDYAYFTDREGRDPDLLSGLTDSQRNACRGYYQDGPGYPTNPEATPGRWRSSNCTEIQFANNDEIKGPMHTNDSIFVASFTGALFGNVNKGDRVEVYDYGEDGSASCPVRNTTREQPQASDTTNCRKAPRLNTGVTSAYGPAARYMDLPEENDDLKLYADETADEPGYTFYGTTRVTLNSNSTMWVTNVLRYGNDTPVLLNYPESGVIYVDDSVSSCPSNPDARYPGVPVGCAVLELSGSYNESLTFGSATDVVIRGNITRQNSQTAVLGLIAEEYVRVRHYGVYGRTGSCTNWTDPGTKVSNIEAAVLTLNRSFTVDAYGCGSHLGDLRVYGSLAQRWRGTVGTGSSGYDKDYNYDYTLKSQSPPRFLAPTAAVWKIIRMRQQVPACACTTNG